jgi:ribosomal protein S18 acetylase RimI-like enzyme
LVTKPNGGGSVGGLVGPAAGTSTWQAALVVTIRTAEERDGEALRAIDVSTWGPDVSPGPAPDEGEPFFGERRKPGDHLVAEVDGEVAGYAVLQQPIPLPSHSHVLIMNGLAVAPDHQGQGLGRRLVEATKEEARRRGARKLTLRVLGPNIVARALYESCGFEVEGVLRGEFHLEGRDVDDALMAWWV